MPSVSRGRPHVLLLLLLCTRAYNRFAPKTLERLSCRIVISSAVFGFSERIILFSHDGPTSLIYDRGSDMGFLAARGRRPKSYAAADGSHLCFDKSLFTARFGSSTVVHESPAPATTGVYCPRPNLTRPRVRRSREKRQYCD